MSQDRVDLVGPAPDQRLGVGGVQGGEALGDGGVSDAWARTAAPRSKLPSTAVTPAGTFGFGLSLTLASPRNGASSLRDRGALTRSLHPANYLTMVVTMLSEMATRIVKASELKAKCLKLMDEVAATGDTITVTKNGRPVVEVRAIEQPRRGLLRPKSGEDRDPR